MQEQVAAFLAALGIDVPEDDPVLAYAQCAVYEELLNRLCVDEVPKGLEAMAVYRIAGQYLRLCKDAGRLEVPLEAAVRQVQEGDTSITYALGQGDQTPEGRFDRMTDWLCGYGEDQLERYRRMLW